MGLRPTSQEQSTLDHFGLGAGQQQQQQQNLQSQFMQFMMQQMGQQQQQPQGPDLGGLLKELKNVDPVGTSNRLSGLPSYAADSQSPFLSGFFNSNTTSVPNATTASAPPRTDQLSNPYAYGGIGPMAQPQQMPQIPFNPTTIDRGGGLFEGLINPNAPDATKYSDPNVFSVQGAPKPGPDGATIIDEKGPYNPKKKKPKVPVY